MTPTKPAGKGAKPQPPKWWRCPWDGVHTDACEVCAEAAERHAKTLAKAKRGTGA